MFCRSPAKFCLEYYGIHEKNNTLCGNTIHPNGSVLRWGYPKYPQIIQIIKPWLRSFRNFSIESHGDLGMPYIPYFKNPISNSQLSSHNAMLNHVTISWLTQLVFFLLQPSSWLVAAEGQALPSGQHVFLGAVWLCSYVQWSGFVKLHEVHLPFWHHHSNHHLVVSTHPKI